MSPILRFLYDLRVEKLQRQMVKHGAVCCVGLPDTPAGHCAKWAALSSMYEDALRRRQQ